MLPAASSPPAARLFSDPAEVAGVADDGIDDERTRAIVGGHLEADAPPLHREAAVHPLASGGALLIDHRFVQPDGLVAGVNDDVRALQCHAVGALDVEPDRSRRGTRAQDEVELRAALAAVEDEIGRGVEIAIDDTTVGRKVGPPAGWILRAVVVELGGRQLLGLHAPRARAGGQGQGHGASASRAGRRPQTHLGMCQLQPRPGAKTHVADVGARATRAGCEEERKLRDLRAYGRAPRRRRRRNDAGARMEHWRDGRITGSDRDRGGTGTERHDEQRERADDCRPVGEILQCEPPRVPRRGPRGRAHGLPRSIQSRPQNEAEQAR